MKIRTRRTWLCFTTVLGEGSVSETVGTCAQEEPGEGEGLTSERVGERGIKTESEGEGAENRVRWVGGFLGV